MLEDWRAPINITAVYCPPKHNLKEQYFTKFFKTLGKRFIAGGDYNAKHTYWGSRLTLTKGRELLKTIETLNLGIVSSGHPTYWPSDNRKVPDLIDFCVTKGISTYYISCEASLELSSDHTPVFVTLQGEISTLAGNSVLCTKKQTGISSRTLLIIRSALKLN